MEFITKEIINKGWSSDKKYCATGTDGKKYLLRVSDIKEYERKKSEFELMQKIASLGVPMCLPLEFGTFDGEVYSVQSFIDGDDAENVVPTFDKEKQYEYGFKSGKILKTIHSVPAPDNAPDWERRFNSKIDKKINLYQDCPLKYENGELFINFIEKNRHLLKNRPQVYQHGDYHIGNMMIDSCGMLYIIDFNRSDYGDPWEEFNRIVWCAQKTPYFASGMVDGYFDKKVPIEFWKLLALYISSNTLSSLPWAIPFGEGEIKTMTNQAREVLSWYSSMQKYIPSWYIS